MIRWVMRYRVPNVDLHDARIAIFSPAAHRGATVEEDHD